MSGTCLKNLISNLSFGLNCCGRNEDVPKEKELRMFKALFHGSSVYPAPFPQAKRTLSPFRYMVRHWDKFLQIFGGISLLLGLPLLEKSSNLFLE